MKVIIEGSSLPEIFRDIVTLAEEIKLKFKDELESAPKTEYGQTPFKFEHGTEYKETERG